MTVIATERVRACNSCGAGQFEEVGQSPDFEYATADGDFTFGRCTTCGLVHLLDRPTVAMLPVIYPKNYIPYNFDAHLGPFITRLRAAVQHGKVAAIARYAQSHALIMDVGPGNGELLRLLQMRGDSTWSLVGVDFSPDAVANVRRLGLRCEQSRFEDLAWHGTAPDVVILNQVIEHLADPSAAVQAAFSLLKPGGHLVIETPSTDGWDAKWFRRRHWGGWHTPRHWVLYNQATLQNLLRSKGFQIAEVTYLLSPNFWLQSVHHWVIDRLHAPRLAKLFDVSNLPFLAAASALDVVQRAFTGRTSNFRIVGQKPVG